MQFLALEPVRQSYIEKKPFEKILKKFQEIGYKGYEVHVDARRRSSMERFCVNSLPVLVVNYLWKKAPS